MLEEDLLKHFLNESQDHLATIEDNLLKLESDPLHVETINSLFRAIHSIKGGSGVFSFNNMSHLGHSMENLISKVRDSELTLGKKHIDALLHGVDTLRLMINDVTKIESIDVKEMVGLFESFIDPSQLKPEGVIESVVAPEPVLENLTDKISDSLRTELHQLEQDIDILFAKSEPLPNDFDIIIGIIENIRTLFTSLDAPNTIGLISEFKTAIIKWSENPVSSNASIQESIVSIIDHFHMLTDDLENAESVVGSSILQSIAELYPEFDQEVFLETAVSVDDFSSGHQEIIQTGMNISTDELKRATKAGMDIYSIDVNLNRDILERNKTPYDFIMELEELGQFIGSYLAETSIGSQEVPPEDDLKIVFLFGSIIDPSVASDVLKLNVDQIKRFDESELDRIQENIMGQGIDIETEAQASETLEIPSAPFQPPVPVGKKSLIKPSKTDSVQQIRVDESIRVGVGKLNKLVDLAGELVLVRNQLLQTCMSKAKRLPKFMTMLMDLNVITTDLQEDILNTRMQPVSTVFGKFPRLIRELGTKLGKDIQLQTEGNEVELDKTVLEALSDPLTHIVRNTADHGIEMPEEREQKGKSSQGKLLLKAFHASGQVIIQVEDDGGGIDPQRISDIAFEKGLITQEALSKMNDQERINLIFLPGFSTAQKVSSVSGRGVGMDVVRSNIDKIGGTVNLSSIFGAGTTIKMTLPLTMAIVSSLIIEAEGEKFAIPQVNLDELVMLQPDECLETLGFIQEREVLRLRGELLPLISLSEALGMGSKKQKIRSLVAQIKAQKKQVAQLNDEVGESDEFLEKSVVRILIVSGSNSKIGIVIDSIIGNEEIVVKPMPEYLKDLKSFSGATILGDGSVAMIIDIIGLMESNDLTSVLQSTNESFLQKTKKNDDSEKQSILIFNNGSEEQFAITISLIGRVDKINSSQIQKIGNKEYIEYRNSQVRLLRLHDYLPIGVPDETPDIVSVIFPKETQNPVAILIYQVVDTQIIESVLSEGTIQKKGILGSILIDRKITLLLDLFAIIEMGEPESLYRIDFNMDRVRNINILLVEDTPLFQIMIKEYLKSVGFQVTLAENGQVGFECLQKNDYDIVLSDIEMPVLDGFGLIKKIRSNKDWDNLPVVAVTSLNDAKTVQSGFDAGFTDWMVKLDKPKILSAIQKFTM
ncbi:MAG: response regulator [Deltaproteobacteria bacterium]|jgi:two-component system, chemotaxis family, sensor kinase CheA|nr:response regulator [Deltaproteobacteria bacterium]